MKKLFFLVSILLLGCEGYIVYTGRVIDESIGIGIDSTLLHLYVDGKYIYTRYSDSAGYFDMTYGVVGCVPSCPESELTAEKNGFEFLSTKHQNDSLLIFMIDQSNPQSSKRPF